MKTFHVYHHPDLGTFAVKEGFSWPAFIFGWVWMLVSEMWLFAISFLALAISFSFLIDWLIKDNVNRLDLLVIGIFQIIFSLGISITAGIYGNRWRYQSLAKRGFTHINTLQAKGADQAIQATPIPPKPAQKSEPPPIVWYKQFWPWFILALLGYSVIQGLALLNLATRNPPGLISDDYYDVGKGINQSLEREKLAERLQLHGELVLDNTTGTALLSLQGNSKPQQIVLNLISPTQPERDRRVILQPAADGQYRGQMVDEVSGRRFVELLGQEGSQSWRLFEEENISDGGIIQIGDNPSY